MNIAKNTAHPANPEIIVISSDDLTNDRCCNLAMSTATDMLQSYIDAEVAILGGQEMRLNGRSLTRADLAEVRKGRAEWQRTVNTETRIANGGGSLRHQLPDFTD